MILLVGERYKDSIEAGLTEWNDPILWVPDDPDADPRLSGHIDLNVFTPDNFNVFIAEGIYPRIVNYLTNRGYCLHVIRGKRTRYPNDSRLCVCSTSRYTIYNPKTCAPEIIPFLKGSLIAVRQGYTKCSVCVVSSDAIITPDQLIASRAEMNGMDVLRISEGHIALEGYNYGFIGGSTFLLNEKTIAITGSLYDHPDKDRILGFLRRHGVEPVFLTERPIFDIGGAVVLP